MWMVTFSHGIPAGLLYVAFLVTMFVRTRRGRSRVEFFTRTTIVIAIVQLPFYGALPAQIFVVMVAAALALRERRAEEEDTAEENPFRSLGPEPAPSLST